MREYFRSPYVVIGVIGVVYYLYRRNILINELLAKNLPAINDLFNEKEDNVVIADKVEQISKEFKDDVKKMSFAEMKKSVEQNEKLIKSNTLKPSEKKKIDEMLKYMVDYNNKKKFR